MRTIFVLFLLGFLISYGSYSSTQLDSFHIFIDNFSDTTKKIKPMDHIDSLVEERLHYYVRQLGGEKELEKFYGITMDSLRRWGRGELIKNGIK